MPEIVNDDHLGVFYPGLFVIIVGALCLQERGVIATYYETRDNSA